MAKTARPLRPIIALLVLLGVLLGATGLASTIEEDSDASFAPGLALDLEGGVQLILTPKLEDDSEDEVTTDDVEQAIAIIRQRVDASGVAEAEITRQGQSNIVVGLPGNPSEETLDLVRQSAQLRFRPVLAVTEPGPIDPTEEQDEQPADQQGNDDSQATDPDSEPGDADGDGGQQEASPPPAEESAGPEDGSQTPSSEDVEEAAREVADADGDGELATEPVSEPSSNSDEAWLTEQLTYELYTTDCTAQENLVGGGGDDTGQPLVACDPDGEAKYALGPTDVEGGRVASASSGLEQTSSGATTNRWVVSLDFDSQGTTEFRDTSQRLVGLNPPQNQFGIVLDGLVISAPQMNEAIPDGTAQISGDFNQESAGTLANQLNFGSLPLNFDVQSQEQISATLGSEHLQIGLLAGLIGLALVALYLLWQYRALATVAIASLLLAAATTYATIITLSWLQGYRLSLAGVAGLIVAVGITADSFILYFERLRDELREGHALPAAVARGWERAKRTIVISDIVTLLAAVVLYFLAVGGVRGFAFTLGLTTAIDLVIVFLFTHPAVQLLSRSSLFVSGHKLSGLNPADLGVTLATYQGRSRLGGRGAVSQSADDVPPPGEPQATKQRKNTKATNSGDTPDATNTSGRMTIAERRAAERRAAEPGDETVDAPRGKEGQ